MPANYILLERIELNAPAASVTFSNIPQSGYTDLKVAVSARGTDSNLAVGLRISFNGVTTNLSDRYLFGTGAAASSGTDTFIYINEMNAATSTANTFTSADVYIPNYTSSNFKSVSVDAVMENNATTAYSMLNAGLWSSTAAITSVTIYPSSTSLASGSTFSLYGLAALGTTPVIAPKASGGNIQTDGTYWYHTFLTTGAFVPQTTLSCDTLVVAGGGGGGVYVGGGGGAGGLLSNTSQSLSAQSYTITVGAGAPGPTSGAGVQGSNSQIGSLTAAVGGGGGTNGGGATGIGTTGGSGGGGGSITGGTAGLAGTSGQGFAGGSSAGPTGNFGSGGGGGAGAVGSSGGSTGGTGGIGATSATITAMGNATTTGQLVSSSRYYAGGGGGAIGNNASTGVGGSGGGGTGAVYDNAGNVSTVGTNGTVNTGGGAGGGSRGGGGSGTSNSGGSGIVIIRYPIA